MAACSRSLQNIVRCTCDPGLTNIGALGINRIPIGEEHEDATRYSHPCDGYRLAGVGAARSLQGAAGLPAERHVQRLSAERMVPHRRVVKFDRLLERFGGADTWSAPRHILFTSSRHLHHWHNTLAAIVHRRPAQA